MDNAVIRSQVTWTRIGDGGGDLLEWIEIRPGVRMLRRKSPQHEIAVKMSPPPRNKMRRKSEDK